jgi:hypothetical protein
MLAAASVGACVLASVGPSAVAGAAGPTTLPSQVFATNTATRTIPDDITLLNGHIFTGFQNGVGPDGAPGPLGANSTVVEYARDGRVAHTWSVRGKVDGLTADPAHDRLIATVNEDLNSSLYVLRPGAEGDEQLVHYTYDPSPAEPNPTPPTATGGGTDSVAIKGGRIYITHSAPALASSPAVYEATLDSETHVAHLRSVFADNATATDAVSHQPVTLALTDPDSNLFLPAASPRYASQLVQVAQADGQMVFVKDPASAHPSLTMLALSQPSGTIPTVNDLAVATSDEGTLYVTDPDKVVALSTKGLPRGTVFVAETKDTGAPLVGTLDLGTGKITPLGNMLANPHGLLFVPSGHGHNCDDGCAEGGDH